MHALVLVLFKCALPAVPLAFENCSKSCGGIVHLYRERKKTNVKQERPFPVRNNLRQYLMYRSALIWRSTDNDHRFAEGLRSFRLGGSAGHHKQYAAEREIQKQMRGRWASLILKRNSPSMKTEKHAREAAFVGISVDNILLAGEQIQRSGVVECFVGIGHPKAVDKVRCGCREATIWRRLLHHCANKVRGNVHIEKAR